MLYLRDEALLLFGIFGHCSRGHGALMLAQEHLIPLSFESCCLGAQQLG